MLEGMNEHALDDDVGGGAEPPFLMYTRTEELLKFSL